MCLAFQDQGRPSQGSSPVSQENERTKDLIVDQKFHRTIIGQKGEKIKEVRDKFPEVCLYSSTSAVSAVDTDGVFSASR